MSCAMISRIFRGEAVWLCVKSASRRRQGGASAREDTRDLAHDPAGRLLLVGSSDGTFWWTLRGQAAGDTLTFDFAPLGGTEQTGRVVDGVVTWADGSQWTRLDRPPKTPPSPSRATARDVLRQPAASAQGDPWDDPTTTPRLASIVVGSFVVLRGLVFYINGK